ncbi:MAG: hypothetical protein V1867_07300 [Candidatus Falkowbacteria bacterium]
MSRFDKNRTALVFRRAVLFYPSGILQCFPHPLAPSPIPERGKRTNRPLSGIGEGRRSEA